MSQIVACGRATARWSAPGQPTLVPVFSAGLPSAIAMVFVVPPLSASGWSCGFAFCLLAESVKPQLALLERLALVLFAFTSPQSWLAAPDVLLAMIVFFAVSSVKA